MQTQNLSRAQLNPSLPCRLTRSLVRFWWESTPLARCVCLFFVFCTVYGPTKFKAPFILNPLPTSPLGTIKATQRARNLSLVCSLPRTTNAIPPPPGQRSCQGKGDGAAQEPDPRPLSQGNRPKRPSRERRRGKGVWQNTFWVSRERGVFGRWEETMT